MTPVRGAHRSPFKDTAFGSKERLPITSASIRSQARGLGLRPSHIGQPALQQSGPLIRIRETSVNKQPCSTRHQRPRGQYSKGSGPRQMRSLVERFTYRSTFHGGEGVPSRNSRREQFGPARSQFYPAGRSPWCSAATTQGSLRVRLN